MDNQKIKEVERLLEEAYGLDISDVNEGMILRDLANGEDPEAIVRDIGEREELDLLIPGYWNPSSN
jgi:hypothetical protein